jgi:hypothetical protein
VVAPVVTLVVPLPKIIAWARRVEKMSAEVDIVYRDGITGSHFDVGGMDLIMIPLQVSSDIISAPKLSTAAFLVRKILI